MAERIGMVFVGQVDNLTGGPPRLSGAVIVPEEVDAIGQVEAKLLAGRHQTRIDWTHGMTLTIDQHPDIYSTDEFAAIKRFHAVWEATADSTPNPLPPSDQVQLLAGWNNLRRTAEHALSVFLIRGPMSNDQEQEASSE